MQPVLPASLLLLALLLLAPAVLAKPGRRHVPLAAAAAPSSRPRWTRSSLGSSGPMPAFPWTVADDTAPDAAPRARRSLPTGPLRARRHDDLPATPCTNFDASKVAQAAHDFATTTGFTLGWAGAPADVGHYGVDVCLVPAIWGP